MASFGGKAIHKPLKGQVMNNAGFFGSINANSIVLNNMTVTDVYDGNRFVNVTIDNSNISNTSIGLGGASDAYFTNLKTSQTVNFYGSENNKYVTWDPATNVFKISGELNVDGCSYLDNIEICVNTISATNTDGDIIILPNGNGRIFANGAIVNTATTGNFSSTLLSGSFNVDAYSNISMGSRYSNISMSSYNEHNIETLNGDINLYTETGSGTKFISDLTLVSSGSSTGLYRIQTSIDHNLNVGDVINVQGVNYAPFNRLYTVNNIINNKLFTFTSGNIQITRETSGIFDKIQSNNINLNAGLHVKIPTNKNLVFGPTSNNIVGDTLNNLVLSTPNNIYFKPLQFINIPQNIKNTFGTSGNNYINFDGNFLNIASDVIQNTGALTLINTVNTRFYDPILTLANYTLNSNDYLDRGIEFNYYNTSITKSSLGWFGYKNNLNAFAFLVEATNNNEIITGTSGNLIVGNLNLNGNLTFNSAANLNLNCGLLQNVKTITGCGDVLNISGKNIINITSGILYLNASNSINIPNNVPVNLGTNGNMMYESVTNDIVLTGVNNIKINATNGIFIPNNVPISFVGYNSTTNNTIIKNDTSGNLIINTSSGTNTIISSANVIVPLNTNIQFGNSSKTIYGLNNSLNLLSDTITNIVSLNNVNVMSSIGNLNLNSPNGDITLYTTLGNVRVPSNVNLVFGSSQTVNSISVSNGNMYFRGSGANDMYLSNLNNLYLSANQNVNILDNTRLNIGTNNQKYIYSDTNSNTFIVNNSGSLVLNSQYTSITSNNLNANITDNILLNSNNFYITSANTIIGTYNNDSTLINSSNFKVSDPNLTINYKNTDLLADKGIGYLSDNNYGWFGVKTSTNRLTFYSSATESNNIISGVYGDVQMATLYANSGINVSGDINLNCNSLINAKTISSCNGDITITCSNLLLSAQNKIQIPYNTLLMFGTMGNTITGDTFGNLNLNTANASGTIIINGNLQVNGISTNVYSTITNIQDPIISIGGVTGPIVNDAKDRGLEFKWAQNGITKTGFFGFQSLTNRFVFIPDGTNLYEVYYGSYGSVQFSNGFFNNLDISLGGNLTGVSNINSNTVNNLLSINSSNLNLNTNTTIPYNNSLFFGNTTNSILCNTSNNLIISAGSLSYVTNAIQINNTTPTYYGNDKNILISRDSNGNFNISNTIGSIQLSSSKSINVLDKIPINFGSTSDQIYSDNLALYLIGYNGINLSSGTITLSGNVNITGNLSSVSSDVDINKYILPLGTSQILNITNISNNTNGQIQITLVSPSYVNAGDSITLLNTNSNPKIDGTYTVTQVLNSLTFTINKSTTLLSNGDNGNFKTNLTTDQGKDVGIQVNYWTTSANNLTSSGSANYKTGFFGYKLSTNNWTFYNEATISNNVVTGGKLGSITIDTLNTNNISGFVLNGDITAGSNAIIGSNFIVSGGTIDNTPIGSNVAQSGRFNILSNTVSASFENVSLQSNLMYSFERYSLNSLNKYQNPDTTKIVSFVSVLGVSFNASGTLGTLGISDGQIKTIVCSAMGDNSTYTIHIGQGNIIAPNIGNNIQPSKLQFIRAGQTVQLIFDNQLSAWIILGRGCSVI